MLQPGMSADVYLNVGRSAINVLRTLYQSQMIRTQPASILDFGCGHGRIARHLRAWAPDAALYAADVRADGIAFCASQFGCVPVQLTPTFGEVTLPKSMDLIWVGSVFTHIDRARMTVLFDWLWDSLAPGGHLVITTHGAFAKDLSDSGQRKFFTPKKWAEVVEQYQRTGAGYASYDREDLGEWGFSLTSDAEIARLGEGKPDGRLRMFLSGGWARLQDVFAWQKVA